MTKKVKVATLHPVQLMVIGIIGQAGEAVPKIVEVDTDTVTVIATHQGTAEMIVGARKGKVSPVIGKDVHLYLRILREMLLKLFVSSAAKTCFSSFYKNVLPF